MSFKIVRNDITRMETEAIVNTANARPVVGPGCDSAVYHAAGYEELLAYRKEKIGSFKEGDAFLTPGFRLKAKYIIHAVSPLFHDGSRGEEKKLRACYQNALKLAKEHQIRSVAFPLISTGGFGYPKEEGMRIAVDEIHAFLLRNEMEICLVVFGDETTALGERLYPNLEEYIDRNYEEKKRAEEYSSPAYRREYAPSMQRPQAARMEDAAYADFEKVHESALDDRIRHVSDTFSQYLQYLIRKKKMNNAEVYKRTIVDKKTFSKIKNNRNYHPQKLTALCLCVGAKLNLDESKDLLARAGYALSPCDKTDIIFSYFIENEIYDMIELDIQLEEHGLPCIIS